MSIQLFLTVHLVESWVILPAGERSKLATKQGYQKGRISAGLVIVDSLNTRIPLVVPVAYIMFE